MHAIKAKINMEFSDLPLNCRLSTGGPCFLAFLPGPFFGFSANKPLRPIFKSSINQTMDDNQQQISPFFTILSTNSIHNAHMRYFYRQKMCYATIYTCLLMFAAQHMTAERFNTKSLNC